MAASNARLFSLEEVQASVKRMQTEGERLVGRLRRDARRIVERNGRPAVESILKLADVRRLRADARKRAEQAIEELESGRARLRAIAEKQLARLGALAIRQLGGVTQAQFAEVSRRLADVERRLDKLAKAADHRAA